MSSTYFVFGLTLHSSGPLPGLAPVQDLAKAPDIELHLGSSPLAAGTNPNLSESLIYVSSYTDPAGAPALRIWRAGQEGLLHLAYFDGMQFWMDQSGSELWALWPDQSSIEDAATYLLGPVLGLLLRFRGVTCLHASAVAFEGSIAAFVGAEGAGKSTTAAAFARSGCAVVSDDVVALVEREDNFWVSPAYPHVCLWPNSVELLFGSADALPPLSPNWEKRRLALGDAGLRYEQGALPLRAIYILDDHRSEPGPFIEAIPAQEGFFLLVANSYATNILDSEMRTEEFRTLSSLVLKVPIRRLFTSRGTLPPEELCTVVRRDFAELAPRK